MTTQVRVLNRVLSGRAVTVEFPEPRDLELAESIIQAIHSCIVRFPEGMTLSVTPRVGSFNGTKE